MSRKLIYVLGGLTVMVLGFVVGLVIFSGEEEAPVEETTSNISVQVATVAELRDEFEVSRTAIVEPQQSAPIVARAGGRLTSLSIELGDIVTPGVQIGRTDGNGEPNIAAAQLATAGNTLSLFGAIEQQAVVSLDNAIALANQSLEAARAGATISTSTQANQIKISSNAVDQSLESLRRAEELDDDDNPAAAAAPTVRAAELAVEAAQLAKNQAQIQANLATRNTGDTIAQARLGVQNTEAAKNRTLAELSSQRAQLAGGVATAREQVRMQYLTSPIAGTVRSLNVSVGDFLQPNQVIGEIASAGKGQLSIQIPSSVKDSVAEGTQVAIEIDGQIYNGVVHSVAGSASGAGLFNAIIHITDTLPAEAFGASATVTFNVDSTSEAVFVPLDAIATRSDGTYIFTVEDAGTVKSHAVDIVSYQNESAEIVVPLFEQDRVIVSNVRLLQDGDVVEVIQ